MEKVEKNGKKVGETAQRSAMLQPMAGVIECETFKE